MSFALYLLGFVIFIGGLIYGADRLGVSHTWIAIGAVILLGIAIFTGAVKTRRRDPSES
jgi:small basic protein